MKFINIILNKMKKNNKLNLPKISLYDCINPYLITKYDLKSIALYWNNNIIEGINYYYKNDC